VKRKSQSTSGAHKRKAPRSAWKPGQSGNPGGRPKTDPELVEAFRERTPRALATLDKVMANFAADVLTEKGDPLVPPAAAVKAAEVVLNRGWGTAPATVKLEANVNATVDATSKVAVKVLDPERLARVVGVLQRAGALPGAAGAPEPEADETKEEPS